MDLDESFAQVVGRPPTHAEKARLEHACEVWSVRGNEGLLAVLLVLHFGAPGQQDYPRQCAEAVKHSVRHALTRRPSRPSLLVGNASSGSLAELLAVIGTGAGGLVLLGLGSLALGASPAMRWSAPDTPPEWLAPRVLVPTMAAPAGWTLLLALATPAFYAALWGWTRARDTRNDRRTRLTGWAAFMLVNLAFWGWCVLLVALC